MDGGTWWATVHGVTKHQSSIGMWTEKGIAIEQQQQKKPLMLFYLNIDFKNSTFLPLIRSKYLGFPQNYDQAKSFF